MKFREGKLILDGDFNVPLDPKLDTSPGTSSVPNGTRKCVLRKFYELQLIDAWWALHAEERDYTYFSNPHQLYSQIDFFF